MQPGPRIYNLFPLLAGSVREWRGHLSRVAEMGFDWLFVNPFHLPGVSGSLYAVKDYYELHPLFRGGAREPAGELLRDFCTAARAEGLQVMMDLVINHTAKDSALAVEHPDWYVREADGSLCSPFAIDPADASNVTVWRDLAELDYSTRPARHEMVAYWKHLVRHYAELGFTGFRCDAAYKLPGEVWAEIIAFARESGEVTFFAETLGCRLEEMRQLAGADFDFFFNSAKWWDFRADWLLDQYEAFRTVAPSISFPESHDTPRLAAELADDGVGDLGRVEAHYRLRYLFAAYFSSGVMMPMGYERGLRTKLDVVRTRPDDEGEPLFDLSPFIRDVNRMKAALPALNEEGPQARITAPDEPVVALVRRTNDGADWAAALINPDALHACDADAALLFEAAGGEAGAVEEVSPGAGPPPASGGTLRLPPLGMRVFVPARRRGAP